MERKIGEVFQDGEVTLAVEKSNLKNGCDGCYYENIKCHRKFKLRGYCTDVFRSDNTPIIFKQITQ